MKVLIPTHYSPAIARIGDQMVKYAPAGVETGRINAMRKDSPLHWQTPGEKDGDVVVLFCNGLLDHHKAQAWRCKSRGQKYAVVQIALRTTRNKSTREWRELWSNAQVVWTYYPLKHWLWEDEGQDASVDFEFFHAPLGVDATIFTPGEGQARTYTICTSGARKNHESVDECDRAVAEVGGAIFQLGPTFPMRATTTFRTGISDYELAEMYRQTQFVSGLRKIEGFELPAAEGLLCGCRPVMYDRPHYRCWFDSWAEFIPERGMKEIVGDLTELFRKGPRPVTAEERFAAMHAFDWKTIMRGFWDRVLYA